jgi:hypothetical protein
MVRPGSALVSALVSLLGWFKYQICPIRLTTKKKYMFILGRKSLEMMLEVLFKWD